MITTRMLRLGRRGMVAVGSFLLSAVLASSMASAAPIAWAQRGAFEACLEGGLEKWLGEQAALEVGEDPAAAQLDAAAVAGWTAETVAQCRTRAGTADATSVEKFTEHMAQWRRHIYDVAAEIRKKGQSD